MSDCTIVTSGHHGIISEQYLYQTIVQFDKTIVLPRKRATGSIHDYLFCYCPLVGILFEVLRIANFYIYTNRSFNDNIIDVSYYILELKFKLQVEQITSNKNNNLKYICKFFFYL